MINWVPELVEMGKVKQWKKIRFSKNDLFKFQKSLFQLHWGPCSSHSEILVMGAPILGRILILFWGEETLQKRENMLRESNNTTDL